MARRRIRIQFSILFLCLRSLLSKSALEDADTYIIDTGTAKGRATLSSKEFATGETVLKEFPILVWDAGDVADFLREYFLSPDWVQAEVLNLAHLPLNSPSPRVVGLRSRAARLGEMLEKQGIANISIELIHKLLLIKNTNCHPYFGNSTKGYLELRSSDLQPTKEAIFPQAAKVNHACHPNVMFTTETADGTLIYTAIRHIKAHDEITFSYLGEDGETMCRHRRAEILAEKDISCKCLRCLGPDEWRAMRCPIPGCQGLVFPCPPSDANSDTNANFVSKSNESSSHPKDMWSCTNCGIVASNRMTPLLHAEAALQQELDTLTAECRDHFDQLTPHPARAKHIVRRAAEQLYTSHHLSHDALALLSKMWASYANRLGTGAMLALPPPPPPLPRLRQTAKEQPAGVAGPVGGDAFSSAAAAAAAAAAAIPAAAVAPSPSAQGASEGMLFEFNWDEGDASDGSVWPDDEDGCRLESVRASVRMLQLCEHVAKYHLQSACGSGGGDGGACGGDAAGSATAASASAATVDSDLPPVRFDLARAAFAAGQSLMRVPAARRGAALPAELGRFMRHVRARYGADDSDVRDIESMIRESMTGGDPHLAGSKVTSRGLELRPAGGDSDVDCHHDADRPQAALRQARV